VDERRVQPFADERLRERSRNVSQAARLGERHSLGRKKCDAQSLFFDTAPLGETLPTGKLNF
jgi:hypothetical protein